MTWNSTAQHADRYSVLFAFLCAAYTDGAAVMMIVSPLASRYLMSGRNVQPIRARSINRCYVDGDADDVIIATADVMPSRVKTCRHA